MIGLWALENPPRDLLDLALLLLAMLALALALHVAYHVVLVGGCGQTLGKMALGIAVVRRDGGTVGYGRAALRCLGGFLSLATFGLGYAGVLFTAERRGLADWLAGTQGGRGIGAGWAASPGHGRDEPARRLSRRASQRLAAAASATGTGSSGSSAASRS